MESLKKKVFEVCAGLMTIPEFENWFYRDVEIQCSILEDDNVLRLCSIDLSRKDARHELCKFCLDVFDNEEFYVFVIEKNAQKMLESKDEREINNYALNISSYSGWDDSKHLFNALYVLSYQFDEWEYSCYSSRKQIVDEMKLHAEIITEKFQVSTLEEKKKWVFAGLDDNELVRNRPINQPINFEESTKQKRWYQFWK
ncbi:MAG: hypothetical protein HWE22_09905 [Flavobacteriales bacterium]|nr:hypothetical protein [Flavobacteriales bacterium]